MRDLTPDVAAQLAPLPADFTCDVTRCSRSHALRWSDTLDTRDGPLPVEWGMPVRTGDAAEIAQLVEILRASAWQARELARIGRHDLLNPIRTDRHSARPAAGRPLTPEAQELLRNVKAAHDARLAASPEEAT